MIIHAPAKINLSLKITRKREDDFHELETLVLPLPSLVDELLFKPASEFSLECETSFPAPFAFSRVTPIIPATSTSPWQRTFPTVPDSGEEAQMLPSPFSPSTN
jgi:hypothetical protein